MIKLVAFDWNGTLFNDTQAQFKGFNAALRFFKRKPISFKRFRQTYEVPFVKMWKTNGGHLSEMAMQNQVYFESYNESQNTIKLKKNAKKLLISLKKKKIITVIFSNHPSKLVARELRQQKIQHLIAKVLGRPEGDNTHILKRSKEIRLQKYLKNNNISHHEVLCVGDTTEEIELSKKFKYFSAALTTGDCSKLRLKTLKPNFLINDLSKITQIIQKINEHT